MVERYSKEHKFMGKLKNVSDRIIIFYKKGREWKNTLRNSMEVGLLFWFLVWFFLWNVVQQI